MSNHVISILKGDSGQAQHSRCGGCTKMVAQFESLSEANYVPLHSGNTKLSLGTAANNEQAKGLLCEDCLKNPQKKEEGPREAVYVVGNEVRVMPFSNLVESVAPKTEVAVTDEGKEVLRSTETGKITKKGK